MNFLNVCYPVGTIHIIDSTQSKYNNQLFNFILVTINLYFILALEIPDSEPTYSILF